MNNQQKMNLNKQGLILKYISIIEGKYKRRSDLRIILYDFYERVKEIENLKPSDNDDFKKVCPKCGVELSEYTINNDLC